MRDMLRIAVFTVVEVVALVVWLALVRTEAGAAPAPIGSIVTGVAILGVGITVEHLLSYNVINRRPLFKLAGLPLGKKLVVSVIETAIWALWLVLADLNPLAAAVVLAVLLVFEHTFSDNVFKDKGTFARLINLRTVGFSIIEAAGAALWLGFVDSGLQIAGITVLALASYAEHAVAVRLGREQRSSV